MGTVKDPNLWTLDDYKSCLLKAKNQEFGLKPKKRQSVAIVGAGMAGLTAGWLLDNAGFTVEIFEASQRVGGRVRTLREGFTSGLYMEAGAMRIPEEHELTLLLCDWFGLETIDFPEDSSKTLIYVNNVHDYMGNYLAGKSNFREPYSAPCKPAERLFMELIEGEDLNAAYFSNPAQRSELDKVSFGEFLRAFQKTGEGRRNPVTNNPLKIQMQLSDADIDLIGLVMGASQMRASLLEVMRDVYTIGKKKKQIRDGMDCLPRCFSGLDPKHGRTRELTTLNLSGLIHFNSRVMEIDRDKARYVLTYEHPITHSLRQSRAFDYVVLAAPFSALTHVRLDNILPRDRLHAIRNLHYENAGKIILEFSKRFWEGGKIKQIGSGGIKLQIDEGGRSITDLPIRWVHYPSPKKFPHTERGLLLASYNWGDDSLRWTSLGPNDRIRFALRDVAELHDVDQGDLEEIFVGGMSHSWTADEFAFGAFAIFEPFQETNLYEKIWRPHDQIHFAGEHTSLKHAWIEGAVESGIRAAEEIMQNS